jgi:Ca-activated chloride channel family protein
MISKFSIFIFITLVSIVAHGQSPNVSKENAMVEKNALSYGVVVDNSGSYRMIFETIIKSTNQIFEAKGANDEAFLVRFVDADKISLVQDFTTSKDELQSASEEMFIEGGQTAILDGVYFAAKHLAENASANRRKILILITDGEDRKSAAKIEQVLKFLRDEKIQVYTLDLSDGKIYKSLLEKLAKETGGKSFLVEKRSEVEAIVKQLTNAVHAQ